MHLRAFVGVLFPACCAVILSSGLAWGKAGEGERLSNYRYVDERVAYEKLSDKGLRYDQVAPANPIQFGRPTPEPVFASRARKSTQAGSAQRQQVKVQLLEEGGVNRSPAEIRFGFPLPKDALFDPRQMRLLDGGKDIPAQFTATAFWPDDSLKWVLVDSVAALQARERRDLVVEFGREVKPIAASSPLSLNEDAGRITATTGPLRVVMDKRHFNLFAGVWHDADGDGKFKDDEQILTSGDGVVLADEQGKIYTMAGGTPESVKIEMQGPQCAVVRVAGPYAAADGATYMRYVARITLRAGSPRVDVAITQIDDYLKTEFTDISSLSLPLTLAGGVKQASVFVDDGGLKGVDANAFDLFQSDERNSNLKADGRLTPAGKAPGMVRCAGAGGVVTAVLEDFWQRWPKAISAGGNHLTFGLLPPQPDARYGADLPFHLMFPFVEGKYRFKWGMAFTERIHFDFGGKTKPEELLAETQMPVVAVVPAEWYALTEALGPMAAPAGKQFALWDQFVEDGFNAYMRNKPKDREYGYLNYGDWFGEQGFNWGNNEYDLGHGLFMEFARCGSRDLYRWALTSVRHQADVDCVHAYPDPYYVGADHVHSIGHTGMAYAQAGKRLTWSREYSWDTAASNGHTWANGMMDGWYLSGEPRTIESALGLGEHITWAMSRDFKALGTHERSAGWSLCAIMAIYRGTYDPLYLEAAQRIAAVALREQKFDQGGAWPHVLPGDHAGSHPGAVGNNLFLIGILLDGLWQYHAETHEPAVLKSLEAGGAWVMKSWDEKAGGWPYSVTVQGEPLYPPTVYHNQLLIGPLAYTGRLTGNKRMLEIADAGLLATVLHASGGDGKGLAAQILFTSGTMAELQQWYAQTRPDKGLSALDGGPAMMAGLLVKSAVNERHNARTPTEKLFFVVLREGTGDLTALRTPYGSMPKRAKLATIKVVDVAGQVVQEGQCSTDDKYEFRCALAGKTGAEYKVVINDDERGVWTLKGGKLAIVAQTVKGFSIGGVDRSKFYFSVPAGTAAFELRLRGVHAGPYTGIVLTPEGKIAGMLMGNSPGDSPDTPPDHLKRGTLRIKPSPADTGKIWTVVLSAAMDMGMELDGVPPYMALSPEDWFAPKP